MKILLSIYATMFLFHRICNCSTRIEYPGISIDYHSQKDLYLRTGNPDPVFKLKKKDLQKICQDARKSSTYRMVKLDEYTELPEPILLDESYFELSKDVEKKEMKEGLGYVNTQLLLRKKEDLSAADGGVNVFSCATKDGVRYFHLTYGFRDRYFFVFNPVYTLREDRTDMEVKLTSLIEPSAELTKFRDPRHMEEVFTNAMNNPRSGTTRDRLCALNAIQQFRLCATVYDARIPSRRWSINFTREMGHQCLEEWAIVRTETENVDTADAEPSPGKYLNQERRVNVIPCRINSDTTPQFHLTSDPVHEDSVFVLNPEKPVTYPIEGLAERITFVVEGHVKDVPVLKYANTFY